MTMGPPLSTMALFAFLAALALRGSRVLALDCNDSISDDLEDIRSGQSEDCNRNDIPDECELLPTLTSAHSVESLPNRTITSLASADWNSDGRADLAGSDLDTSGVFILLNSGTTPPLGSPTQVAIGFKPYTIASGDLNADGFADLAASNYPHDEVVVFPGRGDGTFAEGVPSPLLEDATSMAFLDVDGDRDLDLVLAHQWLLRVRFYLNDGTARFTPGQVFGLDFQPQGVPPADLDLDGDLDIAVTSLDLSRVLENDAGQFRLRGIQRAGCGMNPAVLDVDRDGRPDFVSTRSYAVRCVRGLTGLELGREALLLQGPPALSLLSATATADFDGDGAAEIAAGVSSNVKQIVFFSPNAPPAVADRDGNGVPDPCDPIPGDCDGDRVTDSVELARGTEVDCNRNAVPDSCDLAAKAEFPPGGSALAGFDPLSVAAADLDGDSDADVVTADTASDTLSVFLNDGAGMLRRKTYRVIANTPNVQSASTPKGVAAADLDGDGDLDLATANDGRIALENLHGSVTVLWNKGSGDFATDGFIAVNTGVHSIQAADFDGDGIADLAAAHTLSAEVSVIASQGAGRFLPPAVYQLENTPDQLAAADLNGDGATDLAVPCGPLLHTLVNKGAGDFRQGPSLTIPGRHFATIALDFDGDGDQDLAGSDTGSSRLHVLRNRGDGRFVLDAEMPFEVRPTGLAAIDADQDGNLDIASCTATWNFLFPASVSVRFNTSQGALGPRHRFPLPGLPIAVAAGDMDRDGREDLIVVSHNQTSQGGDRSAFVSVLLNRTTSASRDCNSNDVPDECDIAQGTSKDVNVNNLPDDCEPDCDRDGTPDAFQLASGKATDCDQNGAIDACDIASGSAPDCNQNGLPDACDTREASRDCDANQVPDECQSDCNTNGMADACEVAAGTSADCNRNTVPDECDLAGGASQDCDANGRVDACEISALPELDCDASGALDRCEVLADPGRDLNGDGRLDACSTLEFRRGDCDGDGKIAGSVTDALYLLLFNFLGGPAPPCLAACDADGDGRVLGSVTDPVYLLQFNFLGGPPPAPPFPLCGPAGEPGGPGCGEYTKC